MLRNNITITLLSLLFLTGFSSIVGGKLVASPLIHAKSQVVGGKIMMRPNLPHISKSSSKSGSATDVKDDICGRHFELVIDCPTGEKKVVKCNDKANPKCNRRKQAYCAAHNNYAGAYEAYFSHLTSVHKSIANSENFASNLNSMNTDIIELSTELAALKSSGHANLKLIKYIDALVSVKLSSSTTSNTAYFEFLKKAHEASEALDGYAANIASLASDLTTLSQKYSGDGKAGRVPGLAMKLTTRRLEGFKNALNGTGPMNANKLRKALDEATYQRNIDLSAAREVDLVICEKTTPATSPPPATTSGDGMRVLSAIFGSADGQSSCDVTQQFVKDCSYAPGVAEVCMKGDAKALCTDSHDIKYTILRFKKVSRMACNVKNLDITGCSSEVLALETPEIKLEYNCPTEIDNLIKSTLPYSRIDGVFIDCYLSD